ncbi:MAG: DNA cytosine methyltransferase [Acutalibacteraceae bacterium]|nr:DNA cytosine methyltransferase [Acutalibacteraceae bacterium]
MNAIDLFCGCGGLSYGFECSGVNILLGIDNDEMALKVFERNHKNAKSICGDITEINYSDIKKVIGNQKIDLIIGGPPCQGMSLSGPRKFDDPRNKLYLSYIRLVEEIKPKAFVIENVPGLVSLFKGQIKENILYRLTALGYKVDYRILCAADYGVPQNRKRVVFVGLRDKFFDFDSIIKKDIVTCEMALSDLPPLIDVLGEDPNEYDLASQNHYQKLMRERSNVVRNHVAAAHSEKVKSIIALVPDGGNYKDLPAEFKSTRNFHVAWTRFRSDKPAPTIDTGHRHHFHYKYNRVPTVRECARLQSFPDDFIFMGNKTQQFRQVGNAVPPLMAQAIAEALISHLG